MTAGVHDMGGQPHDGPVNVPDHQMADWEVLTDAVNLALVARGVYAVDEMRRAQEEIPRERYLALTYYERWLAGIEAVLVARGVVTTDEVDERTAALARQWSGA
jgi:malate synthase